LEEEDKDDRLVNELTDISPNTLDELMDTSLPN
jgi:hypothetical protein